VRRLTVSSTNPGKIREIQLALSELSGWTVAALPAGLPEIEETGATFLENAVLKAVHYSRLVEGFALADDSGLCVQGLSNRPGVRSARYGPTAEERNRRVLDELGAAAVNRAAKFHCVFVVARSGVVEWTTEGILDGQIAGEPLGDSGFGFDPIFWVPDLRKTLAQLTAEEKNRISARGRAVAKLKQFLEMQ
jgi:XTP/dITP diphosphohydrolase